MRRQLVLSESDRWERLPLARRHTVALEYVRRNFRRLRERFGAVSVGVGHRLSKARALPKPKGKRALSRWVGLHTRDGRICTDEICIQLEVKRKWKAPGLGRAARVPDRIRVTAIVRGKRVKFAVPTDVRQVASGRLHATVNVPDGLLAEAPGRRSIQGGFCCEVVYAADPPVRAILSCHHVLIPKEDPVTYRTGPISLVADFRSRRMIARLHDFAAISSRSAGGTVVFYGLDAALAEIVTEENPVTWGLPIRRLADPFTDLSGSQGLRVLTPETLKSARRDRPVPATYVGTRIEANLQVGPGRMLRVKEAIFYAADVRPGDSGSALVNGADELVGMHFYGDTSGYGYAVPAFHLFADGVFERRIRLS